MLELRDLTKTYISKSGVDTEALKGISYSFPQKGLIFIVGKSGSGKSTLLNILGLLDSFDGGDLIINNKSAKDFSQNERDNWRALNIGFIFQEFHIIEKYNIGQNIALSLEIQHEKATKEQISNALKEVGLEGLEKRKSTELSGGQRQRVAIARALVKNPKIILADEPTGNLDSENSKAIFGLLKKLSEQKLVVVISHDSESADRYADEIIYLEDGRIGNVKKGNEFYETVEEVVDGKHDAEKVDALLKSGKKVILIPKIEKKQEKAEIVPYQAEQDKRATKLPVKSKIKLALLAMKSKCVRMLFTILLSCVAISFLGFSDIIGQYDTLRLIKSDIGESRSPFISVSAQSVTENGMLTSYDGIFMLPATQSKLENKLKDNNIDYLRKFNGTAISFNFSEVTPEFSNSHSRNVRRFFYPSVEYFVEIPKGFDFSESGVALSGRLAENNNEVVITNYHLEAYKRLGFIEESGYSNKGNAYQRDWIKVNGFEDIEGKFISGASETQYGLVERFKVVGMLTFDISEYGQFLDMKAGEKLSKAQSDLLIEANTNMQLYFGNLYVNQGFTEHWTSVRMNHAISSLGIGRGDLEQSMERTTAFTLTETCMPFKYSDYISEAAAPQNSGDIDILSELAQGNITTHAAGYSLDKESNHLTITRTGFDPYVRFKLKNNISSPKDKAQIRIEGDFNGGTIQLFWRTFAVDYYNEENSVRLSPNANAVALPLKANEAIIALRIDIDGADEVTITNISIEDAEYYSGFDEFPNIVFANDFTKESISMATCKAVIDINTFQTLLGDEIADIEISDGIGLDRYRDYFNKVKARGVNLSNFTATFEKRWGDAALVGRYTFEVVGIHVSNGRTFIPTRDFGETYRVNAARDFIIPRAGNEAAAVQLFGAGARDNLPAVEEGLNIWLDYSGDIRFILRTTHSGAIFAIDNYFSLFVSIFNIASIVFCAFAMLLTYNFIASSINSRKKDIGILRSLGAKRMDIGWIFIIEVAVIALLEIVLSCFLTMGMFGALGKYFISTMGNLAEKYTLVTYGIRQILIMTAVALVSIAVSVSLPIIRITKKQPVDIIKSNE